VARRNALDLGGADFVPERDVQQMVLHRPSVQGPLCELVIRQAVDRREQVCAGLTVVTKQVVAAGHEATSVEECCLDLTHLW